MATRENCWEFKNCGRQPGGLKVGEMGLCPAATDGTCNGVNGGQNGGRICWAVSGTFCGGKVQGSFAQKQLSCMTCSFFAKVQGEEARRFQLLKPNQVYQECGV